MSYTARPGRIRVRSFQQLLDGLRRGTPFHWFLCAAEDLNRLLKELEKAQGEGARPKAEVNLLKALWAFFKGDLVTARLWLEKNVRFRNDPYSAYLLGCLCLEGKGPSNRLKAKELFCLAANAKPQFPGDSPWADVLKGNEPYLEFPSPGWKKGEARTQRLSKIKDSGDRLRVAYAAYLQTAGKGKED